jgi:DNA-binding protein HU-beta
MNISELAKGVATSTGSSEADAKKAIAAVFDQIAEAAIRRLAKP